MDTTQLEMPALPEIPPEKRALKQILVTPESLIWNSILILVIFESLDLTDNTSIEQPRLAEIAKDIAL
jgi:hypothetical protein